MLSALDKLFNIIGIISSMLCHSTNLYLQGCFGGVKTALNLLFGQWSLWLWLIKLYTYPILSCISLGSLCRTLYGNYHLESIYFYSYFFKYFFNYVRFSSYFLTYRYEFSLLVLNFHFLYEFKLTPGNNWFTIAFLILVINSF